MFYFSSYFFTLSFLVEATTKWTGNFRKTFHSKTPETKLASIHPAFIIFQMNGRTKLPRHESTDTRNILGMFLLCTSFSSSVHCAERSLLQSTLTWASVFLTGGGVYGRAGRRLERILAVIYVVHCLVRLSVCLCPSCFRIKETRWRPGEFSTLLSGLVMDIFSISLW